ncbi:hypothetical protein, partial [Candidatus Electronema sp. TJ]|uniref:hypothetical protein n=1 Tax=Candidatus Electronema sp. TJ TaxID=3401573 RepID=UPI003AA98E5B
HCPLQSQLESITCCSTTTRKKQLTVPSVKETARKRLNDDLPHGLFIFSQFHLTSPQLRPYNNNQKQQQLSNHKNRRKKTK